MVTNGHEMIENAHGAYQIKTLQNDQKRHRMVIKLKGRSRTLEAIWDGHGTKKSD